MSANWLPVAASHILSGIDQVILRQVSKYLFGRLEIILRQVSNYQVGGLVGRWVLFYLVPKIGDFETNLKISIWAWGK